MSISIAKKCQYQLLNNNIELQCQTELVEVL